MADEPPQVRISVGKAYEVMQPERRWAAEGFAKELEQLGLTIDLEVIEYAPGRRELGPVEWNNDIHRLNRRNERHQSDYRPLPKSEGHASSPQEGRGDSDSPGLHHPWPER